MTSTITLWGLCFFELSFGLCLSYFIKNKVDYAIIEVGLGGRLDATNVIKNPVLTILTSISNSSIKKIGHTRSIKELVRKQALLAGACGCHGIICSGSDLKFVKKIFKGEIITPGIRFKGEDSGDQKRIMSPKQAFKNGSSALVMGRSIVKGNIKKNIQRLIQVLK